VVCRARRERDAARALRERAAEVHGASELPNLPGLYFVGVTIEHLVPQR
jgi:hypothetical protein